MLTKQNNNNTNNKNLAVKYLLKLMKNKLRFVDSMLKLINNEIKLFGLWRAVGEHQNHQIAADPVRWII